MLDGILLLGTLRQDGGGVRGIRALHRGDMARRLGVDVSKAVCSNTLRNMPQADVLLRQLRIGVKRARVHTVTRSNPGAVVSHGSSAEVVGNDHEQVGLDHVVFLA